MRAVIRDDFTLHIIAENPTESLALRSLSPLIKDDETEAEYAVRLRSSIIFETSDGEYVDARDDMVVLRERVAALEARLAALEAGRYPSSPSPIMTPPTTNPPPIMPPYTITCGGTSNESG